MSHLKRIVFFSFLVISFVVTASQPITFQAINKAELASLLFNEIERLDASAIRIRNTYKKVNWIEFRQVMTHKMLKAKSFRDLAIVFDDIQQGFTNSHSSFQLYSQVFDSRKLYENPVNKRGFGIGYTFPEVNFFSIETSKYIEFVNGFSLRKRFNQFEQLECEFTHQEACLKKFSKRIMWGLIDLNIKQENELSDKKKSWKETITPKVSTANVSINTNETYCSLYANNFKNWNIKYSSKSVCLLEDNSTYILNIRSFLPWGTSQNDIHCEGDTNVETMCHDIQSIRDLLSQKSDIKLIIDLQGNSGGSENTPFLSLLSKKPFFDNLIHFNNTVELNNIDFRTNIFYGLKSAENWFQKLAVDSKLLNQEFLPVRADFCRGDKEACSYKAINPLSPTLDIKKILLVVDSGCVSSCDDLVWRLKHYSGAYVLGQPPATDSTYSTVSGIIYYTANGQLKLFIKAQGQQYSLDDGSIKLAWFSIPYTSTVDKEGNYIDGDISIINEIIPITIENYSNISNTNVLRAIEYMKKQS
ncbi:MULTISPECIES: S41 family peptidase [unclassified Pseudoalteromonas]|uniref:S41 family peptidase n=1 Tax=unclassified Pseudoalteromonas TaxID=194690 RepID=UPI0005AB86F2|nr:MULTISPECIES: S41 family peptidase [unclassified Pseudoalteromonas]